MRPILSLVALCAFATLSCKKEAATISDEPVTQATQQSNLESAVAPDFTARTDDICENIGGYLEGLPAGYDAGKSYPLLISLHGMGQLGNGTNDLYKVRWYGVPRLVAQQQFPASFTVNGETFSFIVIAPQFKRWPDYKDVNRMIRYAKRNYAVDESRVYVTGLSMGGGATWDHFKERGAKVTAIVPMAGSSYFTREKADKIAIRNPIVWAFHNLGDPVVSSFWTINYVNELNSKGLSIPAKKTIFNSLDHDCWTLACNPDYREDGMNIYEWMLQYKRKITGDEDDSDDDE